MEINSKNNFFIFIKNEAIEATKLFFSPLAASFKSIKDNFKINEN